jgi:hypothetical protein
MCTIEKKSRQLCPDNLIPPYTVQFGHTNLKSESGDCMTQELPGYSKHTNRIKSEDFPLRTVYARMSVQAQWAVPVRIMNVTNQAQELAEGATLSN